MIDTAAVWLRDTALSRFVLEHPWVWSVCSTVHLVGLALVVGVMGMFDARLLGVLRRVPLPALRGFLPWAAGGFALSAVSGSLFVVGAPQQYAHNPAFYAKLASLAIALANVWVFEAVYAERLFALGPHDDTPRAFKVAGAVSIVAWLLVLGFGRLIPFTAHP